MPDSSDTKPTVLLTRNVPSAAQELLAQHCHVRHWESDAPIPRDVLLEKVAGVDGIYCLLTEQIDAELLNAAGPQLKIVSTMSVGYDHIDVDACRTRNVLIGNTPGVLTDTTADLAVALMLATARRLPEAGAAVKDGAWPPWIPEWMTGQDIFGSTVGIVGLGRIGAAFAKRLGGFDCQILYTGPRPKPEMADPVNAAYVDMDTLLAESDFVAIHCPYNENTHHLFSTDAFRKMKPTAILINTSRGGTVDQDALYEALVSGEIAAAGLDVTTPEPLPPEHKLLTLTNCVILPHIGSASIATRTKMALMAAENAIAGMQSKEIPNPV